MSPIAALCKIRDRICEEDPETISDCEQECFKIADETIINHNVFGDTSDRSMKRALWEEAMATRKSTRVRRSK